MGDDLAVLESYIQRCSNWGRWGSQDQLGTVNLITQEKIREAATLVKVGKTISLTMAYDADGPQNGYLGRQTLSSTNSPRGRDTSLASSNRWRRRR